MIVVQTQAMNDFLHTFKKEQRRIFSALAWTHNKIILNQVGGVRWQIKLIDSEAQFYTGKSSLIMQTVRQLN